MKKFLGLISAGLTSIMMFVCLSIPCLKYFVADKEVASYNGWQIITGKTTVAGKETSTLFSQLDSYSIMKTVAIIMLVLGILLGLLTIIMLLQQTKVIKTKFDFNFINVLLLIAFVVCAVILLILVAKFNKDLGSTESFFYSAGIGFILNLVVSALTLCAGIYTLVPSGKKKSKRK